MFQKEFKDGKQAIYYLEDCLNVKNLAIFSRSSSGYRVYTEKDQDFISPDTYKGRKDEDSDPLVCELQLISEQYYNAPKGSIKLLTLKILINYLNYLNAARNRCVRADTFSGDKRYFRMFKVSGDVNDIDTLKLSISGTKTGLIEWHDLPFKTVKEWKI